MYDIMGGKVTETSEELKAIKIQKLLQKKSKILLLDVFSVLGDDGQ